MLAIFDQYGINVEDLAPRTYRLGSAGVLAESFPGLPAEGLSVTCDRRRALAREDLQFLTWDHPLVTGAIDLVLGSEKGNSSFADWPDKPEAERWYLEAIYVLECVAPPHLHVDRFLPPTPLRMLIDESGNEIGDSITSELLSQRLRPAGTFDSFDYPEMIETAQVIVNKKVPNIIAKARREMISQLEHEISRLRELQKVNSAVRQEEIDLLVEQQHALDEHLSAARLRLDALRVIRRGA
jgi:ATP-dependent helicase HepA